MEEAQQELFPSYLKFLTLSFIVKLLHLKVYNKWSNKSFNMLLQLYKDVLLKGETHLKSLYEVKTILRDLDL